MLSNFKKINNVVVMMTDHHLGNLVVSLPAINALKEYFKEKNFYLVVNSEYKEIAETIEGLDHLILYPRRQFRESSLIRRGMLYLKLVTQLRRIAPDVIIDLEGRIVASTLAFLAGAPVRVGSSSAVRPYLYNLKVDITPERHRLYKYSEIASAAGAEIDSMFYQLKATNSKRAVLSNKLSNMGIKTDRPISCIHPGAGRIFRQWTSNGFAETSDWLFSKGFQVVFVGGNGDLNKINEILSLSKHHLYNLGGKLSFGELIALLEISSLYIGNDTGPLHIASAMETLPVVGLFFRPGADIAWYPFTKNSIVLRGDAGCRDCKGNKCQYDLECTKRLSSDEVKAAISGLITTSEEVLWKRNMKP
ncbi:MAG: glycosyltransferase family 9 protein [Nitrospirae bacterium]|nr:glycosyltransferase family 9 protein [Nitrospirota bacterium]